MHTHRSISPAPCTMLLVKEAVAGNTALTPWPALVAVCCWSRPWPVIAAFPPAGETGRSPSATGLLLLRPSMA